jgi:hypothetical protein
MPYMRVWFVWNMRTSAACAHCEKVFGVPESCVQGVLSYEGIPSRRFRWHPQCYVTQGLQYLEDNPPVEGPRGRKPSLNLSKEQQKLRHALVARKSRIKKQKEQAIESGYWWKLRLLEHTIRELNNQIEAMVASST